MFKLLRFLLLIYSCLANDFVTRNKFYLNLGESYVITNNNISFSTSFAHRNYSVIEIETCPSCSVTVKFLYLNLKDDCLKIPHYLDLNTCRCNYIWIAEATYEQISGIPFCGYWNGQTSIGRKEQKYKSQTRAIVITFFYVENEPNEFSLHIISERNRQFFSGNPQSSDVSNLATGIVTSPFFPANYPRDLVSEYIISCVKYPYAIRYSSSKDNNKNSGCAVRLIFMDFQLSSLSVLEIFDGNQERIGLASGLSFRPPVILTNSSRIRIRFTANGGQALGFKAMYSFIQGRIRLFITKAVVFPDAVLWDSVSTNLPLLRSGSVSNSLLQPNTDCGGLVEDLGGVITMVNMVSDGAKNFDCVWLVRPSGNYFGFSGNLYLKVNTFTNFDYAEMEIREGLFSESPLVEKIFHSSVHFGKEHITSSRSGFYINLKATFGPSSVLGIAFTSFHYNKCFTGPGFLCLNNRCVPRQVVCDSFDHCGDSSDESELCFKDWTGKSDRNWDSLTPNYYFRKVVHFSELKTVVLIFIVSSLGLILFLAILIMFLFNMGSHSRQSTDVQSRMHTITHFSDDVEVEEIINDDPPNYEYPPDYEMAIKDTAILSKEHQIDNVDVRSEASEISSGRPNFVFLGSEATSNGSSGRLNRPDFNEFERNQKSDFLQSNIQLLPDSPPPPYTENKIILMNSTSGNASVSTELSSHVINIPDGADSATTAIEDECV